MGRADDSRRLGLPEDLREGHRLHPSTADEVPEDVPRAHGGELVRVPHHHQAAVRLQGREQGAHEGQVHHAHLVDNDRLRLQGVLLAALEHHLLVLPGGAQGPVDGLGLPAAELPQALGRPPRGGHQHHGAPHPVQQGHDAPHGGGLARAGASGEEHYPLPRGQLHRPPLGGSVCNALPGLDLGDGLLHPLRDQPVRLEAEHPVQPGGDVPLRLVEAAEVAGLHPGHLLPADRAPLHEAVQSRLHHVRRTVDEAARRVHQLVPGEEDVAVAQVVTQLEEHRCVHPPGAVPRQALSQGDGVHDREIHPVGLIHQEVGVFLHLLQGFHPIAAVEAKGQGQRQVVAVEKVHQPPHPRVVGEALGDLPGLPGRDAPDLAQALRRFLQHRERLSAEARHDPLRRGRPHALDDPGP